jgi:YegS/Rv2252/BmrU family lipid kinase
MKGRKDDDEGLETNREAAQTLRDLEKERKPEGEWLAVVNPNAGRRKGEKDWPEIAALLTKKALPFRAVFTRHRGHATTLCRQYLQKGFRNFLIVGGDGTLNEAIHGILSTDKALAEETFIAMIPLGTGNDWCRYHQIPLDYAGAVEVLARGRTMLQDAGLIRMGEVQRHFLNMAGMGYDGLVALKTNAQKEKGGGGPLSYLFNLLASLFTYKMVDARIRLDDREFNVRLFSLSVGICKYNGGGMMQAPNALPDDGLLDLTIIRRLSKWAVIRNVPRLFDGSFTRLPMVFTGQGKEVEIEAEGLLIEADGESVGQSPCRIHILPAAIAVVSGIA